MTQNEQILNDLRAGHTLDPLQVLAKYNCWPLRSRICEIEGKSGHKRMLTSSESISRIPVHNAVTNKRYMSYRLVKAEQAAA